MRLRDIIFRAVLITSSTILCISCNDNMSDIGQSLVKDEVKIIVDSTFNLGLTALPIDSFDARSSSNLLGRLDVPEYGSLSSSYVARLFPVSKLLIPDSIGVERIDSVKIQLVIPRGGFTGDSLAPQQLTIYPLTKQLPDEISNNFDPEGYYDPNNSFGSASYTLSMISERDSLFMNSSYGLKVNISLPDTLAKTIYTAYQDEPEIFAWPETLAKYFPGIYVKNTFGRGAVANIGYTDFLMYYHYKITGYELIDSVNKPVQKDKRDSVRFFTVAPEALSSNNISLQVAPSLKAMADAGEPIIVSPGGYDLKVRLPMKEIIHQYRHDDYDQVILSSLGLRLAAKEIDNDYGITIPPTLLLIKTSELGTFFQENKSPDNISCFTTTYSPDGKYYFSNLANYMRKLLESGEEITDDDEDFTIVPVSLTTQTAGNTEVVTGCVPYVARPTMVRFLMDESDVYLVYTTQKFDS